VYNIDKNMVLLIEDSPSFAAILKQLINKAHGFVVDVASSLGEAECLLENNAAVYFIAIVDYHLPDAPNGEAIARAVAHKIPPIVFTGSADISLKEEL
jgi:two-component system sensor histidine kinase/response regulator